MRIYAELAENDLRLAVEPRPRDILSNTDSALRLFDCVESRNLGAIIDISHLYVVRDVPALAIRKA